MPDEEIKSLLPPNATGLLKDLEKVAAKSLDLVTLNRFVNNPNEAPENILPWLAWAVSADDWSDSWSKQIRRNLIKASIEIHKKKGTIGALKKALQAFNYTNVKVEEWFEYGAEPYFFRVFFDITEPGFDDSFLSEAGKIVENTKNARSHLESIRAYLSAEVGLTRIGNAIISKDVTTLPPIVYEYDDYLENQSSSPLIGAGVISKEVTSLLPAIYGSDDLLTNQSLSPLIGTNFISKEIISIYPQV